jgi:hypothetical protein
MPHSQALLLAVSDGPRIILLGADQCSARADRLSNTFLVIERTDEVSMMKTANQSSDHHGNPASTVDAPSQSRRRSKTSWGMRNGSYATAEHALDAVRAAHAAGDPDETVIADGRMPGRPLQENNQGFSTSQLHKWHPRSHPACGRARPGCPLGPEGCVATDGLAGATSERDSVFWIASPCC